MDKTGGHKANLNQTEREILPNISHMWNPKKKSKLIKTVAWWSQEAGDGRNGESLAK